eukprot:5659400-Pleurochrysis_carterae.AAC.1
MAAKSRLGSVYSPWSSMWSPSAALTALTKVKFTPMPLTSTVCSPGVPVDMAAQMCRFATWRRFALFSRAFLMRLTCCLFFRTLSGMGPGHRGSR